MRVSFGNYLPTTKSYREIPQSVSVKMFVYVPSKSRQFFGSFSFMLISIEKKVWNNPSLRDRRKIFNVHNLLKIPCAFFAGKTWKTAIKALIKSLACVGAKFQLSLKIKISLIYESGFFCLFFEIYVFLNFHINRILCKQTNILFTQLRNIIFKCSKIPHKNFEFINNSSNKISLCIISEV